MLSAVGNCEVGAVLGTGLILDCVGLLHQIGFMAVDLHQICFMAVGLLHQIGFMAVGLLHQIGYG